MNQDCIPTLCVCVCVCSCMCDCVCACMCACDLFCYEVCSFCLSLRVGVFLFFLQSLENEISPLIFKTFCINGRTWYILAISWFISIMCVFLDLSSMLWQIHVPGIFLAVSIMKRFLKSIHPITVWAAKYDPVLTNMFSWMNVSHKSSYYCRYPSILHSSKV